MTSEEGAGRKRRLLVVDDEPAVLRALQRILSRQHEVATAGGGDDAVRLLEQDPAFDLVLCDLMMPRTDGVDVYARAVQLDARLRDRFVFMSGGVFTERTRAFVAAEQRAVLEKPFDIEDVQRFIADALRDR